MEDVSDQITKLAKEAAEFWKQKGREPEAYRKSIAIVEAMEAAGWLEAGFLGAAQNG